MATKPSFYYSCAKRSKSYFICYVSFFNCWKISPYLMV